MAMRSAPESADAGIVKTERKDVGVPLSVVDHPEEDAVGVCAATAISDEKSAAARTKGARGIVCQLNLQNKTVAAVRNSLRPRTLDIPAR